MTERPERVTCRFVRPLRPHLRQPVHVDGGALALFVVGIDLSSSRRARGRLLNRRLRGVVVELLDLRERVHGRLRQLSSHAEARRASSEKGSTVAPPADASAAATASRRSGSTRQKRQPPPPAPQTLPASAPAARACVEQGVDARSWSRLARGACDASHSASRCARDAASSRRARAPARSAERGVADAVERRDDRRRRR